MTQIPRFLALIHDDEQVRFINLDQVKMVEKTPDGYKLTFSADLMVVVGGQGGAELAALLWGNAINLKGERLQPDWGS